MEQLKTNSICKGCLGCERLMLEENITQCSLKPVVQERIDNIFNILGGRR